MPESLPSLLTFADGRRVTSASQWPQRRAELMRLLLDIEYGQLPPSPPWTRGQELHAHGVEALGGASHATFRLTTGPDRPYSFMVDVLRPKGAEPFPVVVNGDLCWRYGTDDACQAVLGRGFAFVQFNRVEIVPDDRRTARDSGLYLVYPEGGYGALAAWAWGYHRVVDFLLTQPWADGSRIGINGHSRGGKTVLLAGATDERISVTAPNDSGCGGAGCFRVCGEGSERLRDILKTFPYWFSPRLKDYVDREDELPFDQHALKALVAPRALVSTEALGDLWANPRGTYVAHAAAAEVYHLLGAGDRIGIWYRQGGHDHSLADRNAFLDFAQWHWGGPRPSTCYGANPFA